jgi:hypothetical protein
VDKRAELDTENAPVPTLRPAEMKDLIRRTAKQQPLGQAEVQRIKAVLPQSEGADLKPKSIRE